MALNKEVVSKTLDRVKVVRMSRGIAKWWNARRGQGDLAVYCGWYWILDAEEHGPFNTYSAAMQDAYYRIVLGREIPSVADSLSMPEAKLWENNHPTSTKPKPRKQKAAKQTKRHKDEARRSDANSLPVTTWMNGH